MRKFTKKKIFIVSEIQDGVVLYSTKISAVSKKSLWSTSLMAKILLNKSSKSVLDIKEFEEK